MSWWTSLRDLTEKALTLGFYDPQKNRDAEREQRNLVNSQIQAYQEQTNLAKQQTEEARQQTSAEKRRVEEKQIRALRRNYRSQGTGLLGVGNPASDDMNSKLGA